MFNSIRFSKNTLVQLVLPKYLQIEIESSICRYEETLGNVIDL